MAEKINRDIPKSMHGVGDIVPPFASLFAACHAIFNTWEQAKSPIRNVLFIVLHAHHKFGQKNHYRFISL